MTQPAPPPSSTGWSTKLIVVAVVLAMALGVLGLAAAGTAAYFLLRGDDGNAPSAAPPPPSPSAAMPSSPDELASYYEQELDWRDCGSNECTRLRVPLDYAAPDAAWQPAASAADLEKLREELMRKASAAQRRRATWWPASVLGGRKGPRRAPGRR